MNRLRTGPITARLSDALVPRLPALPDSELLDRFARYADHSAFEALVRRHGPTVYGVCHRMLADADADDAFQATFLVLIRKARTIRRGDRLGPWLHGVAYRVALKARARAARLARYRTEDTDMIPDPTAPAEVPDWLPVLDAELAALPAKYRDALVLCELQGAARADAARVLGIPEGTLSSRLARGRELLRKRLLKRGVLLPASGLAVLFSATSTGRALVPAALLARTFELAKVATGAASAGTVPVGAAQLTDEVLKGMFLTKLRVAGGAVLAVLTAIGVAAGAWRDESPAAPVEKVITKGLTAPAEAGADRKAAPDADASAVTRFVDRGTVLTNGGVVPTDRDAVQGLWVLEKYDIRGKGARSGAEQETKEAIGKMQVLIVGDVWWWVRSRSDGRVVPQKAVLDPTKNPKWIDWRKLSENGESGAIQGIYELNGDVLRVCVFADNDRKVRPAEFATDPDVPLVMMTFRRGKMPPAAGENALVGSWAGKQLRAAGGENRAVGNARVEILDGHLFLFDQSSGAGVWIGGRYTVDQTKNPKWIDVDLVAPFGESKATKLYGSYEITDGQLNLAFRTQRAARPLEFKDGDGVLSLKRLPLTVRNYPGEHDLSKLAGLQQEVERLSLIIRDCQRQHDLLKEKLELLKKAPVPQATLDMVDKDPEVVTQKARVIRSRNTWKFRESAGDPNAPGALELKAAYESEERRYEEMKQEKIKTLDGAKRLEEAKRIAGELERAIRTTQWYQEQLDMAKALLAKAEKQLADLPLPTDKTGERSAPRAKSEPAPKGP